MLWFVLAFPFVAWADEACPPEGTDAGSLQLLKQQEFQVDDAVTRDALALGLLGCLSSADSGLRDGIAYEALTQWLRGDQLDVAMRRKLRNRLYAMLKEDDAQGFGRPFAALVLAEVARTDRITPWMTDKERVAMVEAAAGYLESVQDYRGYDNTEGWRHGVAHGSDWLMQLSLNPALERAQLERILAAIASQAVPVSAHPYVFGEPGRLARARAVHRQARSVDRGGLGGLVHRVARAHRGSKQGLRGHRLAGAPPRPVGIPHRPVPGIGPIRRCADQGIEGARGDSVENRPVSDSRAFGIIPSCRPCRQRPAFTDVAKVRIRNKRIIEEAHKRVI